ncbi:MAG: hypothetical protein HYS14_00720 [Candidatus Rokubacteria bacterium]|nr:hypothetical protein [Candidatus Rokubacteria bacterium]
MGPLRILQTYPKGDVFTGAAIQLRELAQGLRDRGHHVVVATRPSSEWPEWASQTIAWRLSMGAWRREDQMRDKCHSQRDCYNGVKDARSEQ